LEEWWSACARYDDEGKPFQLEDHPLTITLAKQRPSYKHFHIRGMDGVLRHIEVASIPIVGLQGEFLGAAALFWEFPE
jgi:hypothetical protein